eukprot:SAG22_NODE_5874_length_938_cov_1.237187_1_plen_184_part_10
MLLVLLLLLCTRRPTSGAGSGGLAWGRRTIELKNWVVVKPAGRAAPAGTWVAGRGGLAVFKEHQLLPVPSELMGCDYLAYHTALATAFRLLEDHGVLRLGDCIIQNAPESAVGVAVIQLCRMLRLSCINVLEDSARFEEVSAHLKQTFGATIVLRDTAALAETLDGTILSKWKGIYRPRLALDG